MTSHTEHYNRPPIIVDKPNNRIILRASQAASCRRQLAYYARGEPITNPPDNIAINRMLAGTYLEAVVVDYLKRTNWTDVQSFTDDYPEPPRLTIKLTDSIFITGTPDAHGTHEMTTDNKSTVLEIKTRGNAAWSQMEKLGTMGAFPSAVAQLAFYRKGLLTFQEENRLNLIDPESTGVIVTMNTDTKEVRLFTASDMNLENTLTDLTAKLVPLSLLLLNEETKGTLPAKDYAPSSWQCRYCPFFTTCTDKKNAEKPNKDDPNASKKVGRLEALNALHNYESAAALVVDNKNADANKKEARGTLLDYLKGEEIDQTELIGRSGLSHNIKITTRETTQVDLEQLGQILSMEQYNNIVTKKVTEGVSIR